MKRTLIVALLVAGLAGTALAASRGDVGIGIEIGLPTGLSGKFWVGSNSAVDVLVGWDFDQKWLYAHAGYLFHFPVSVSSGYLAPYLGVGGYFALDPAREGPTAGDIALGGRIPLGLEYIYKPVGFFAEISPLIVIVPNTNFDFGGGVGFRFYF
ncbi:hypothetical protein JXM67_10240 [candidate division WOR-3 bacterium]|nr:hypothetical protein [candidate division WOR-3 bacterium]